MKKQTETTLSKIHHQIDAQFSDHVERCRAFLRQPSVSATGEGVVETAELLRGMIEQLGGTVRFCGAPSHPIVYGRLTSGRERVLIIYGMYDVQPVEAHKWSSPPFGAELMDHPRHGRCIVNRGAVNSKGALLGLFNALRTIVEVDRLPLDLVFVLEGEEEIGSPSLERFVQEHRDELRDEQRGIGVADFDFSEDAKRNVTLHLGLKGIVFFELKCRGGKQGGPSEPQHSSANAWISSPVWRLVQALSSLVDARERIRIKGFEDNVAPISRRDRQLLKQLALTFDEQSFLREIKALCFKYRISGVELLKKGLYSPIINIDGLQAGYTGKGSKTILPRVATAKVDVRFGPNMEPDEVVDKFKYHLVRHGFDDIDVNVLEQYTWSKTEVDEPLVQNLIQAYKQHGRDPQIWPMATWTAPYFVFSRLLRLPVVAGGLGFGNRPHSPDEYMTVEGLRDFEKWVATFLYQLGE